VVLLEGMACSTPVVASDIPGYARVARGGRDALLVTPGDAASLAGAIEKVLLNPDLGIEMVANGQQRAERFSMRRLADQYLRAYTELLSR
jgi:glycosyltransferase involved in cell wall biosynthesis